MAETSSAGRSGGGSIQAQLQQIPGAVGVPIQVLILAGSAFIAVLVGTVSVGAGFALFILGLLALVIVDYMMFQQEQPTQDNQAVSSFVRRGQEEDQRLQELEQKQVQDQQKPQG